MNFLETHLSNKLTTKMTTSTKTTTTATRTTTGSISSSPATTVATAATGAITTTGTGVPLTSVPESKVSESSTWLTQTITTTSSRTPATFTATVTAAATITDAINVASGGMMINSSAAASANLLPESMKNATSSLDHLIGLIQSYEKNQTENESVPLATWSSSPSSSSMYYWTITNSASPSSESDTSESDVDSESEESANATTSALDTSNVTWSSHVTEIESAMTTSAFAPTVASIILTHGSTNELINTSSTQSQTFSLSSDTATNSSDESVHNVDNSQLTESSSSGTAVATAAAAAIAGHTTEASAASVDLVENGEHGAESNSTEEYDSEFEELLKIIGTTTANIQQQLEANNASLADAESATNSNEHELETNRTAHAHQANNETTQATTSADQLTISTNFNNSSILETATMGLTPANVIQLSTSPEESVSVLGGTNEDEEAEDEATASTAYPATMVTIENDLAALFRNATSTAKFLNISLVDGVDESLNSSSILGVVTNSISIGREPTSAFLITSNTNLNLNYSEENFKNQSTSNTTRITTTTTTSITTTTTSTTTTTTATNSIARGGFSLPQSAVVDLIRTNKISTTLKSSTSSMARILENASSDRNDNISGGEEEKPADLCNDPEVDAITRTEWGNAFIFKG
jgi:trimeric autotransporter adhesin